MKIKKHIDGIGFNFLIGKSIIKVEEINFDDFEGYILTCNEGTTIEVETNEGCGGCTNGWSSFDDLKKLEIDNNVITNIEVKYSKEDEDKFVMYVYYADHKINKLNGDDGYGNGYYGGGFYITIKGE